MPAVLITPEVMYQNEAAPYVAILRAAGFEVRYPRDRHFARGHASVAESIAELSDVQAVIASGELYNDDVLAGLPNLRVIARCGVGYDRVDVDAARRRGVLLTITPTANHEGVAEHALALLLAAAEFIVAGDQAVRRGEWPRVLTVPVRGKTLGIVGLGRIGRSLATRAKALGLQVIVCESFPALDFVRQHGLELVDLPTLLARSDFVSLHCPLNSETRGLINRATLAQMKPGSILVNTARGKLVVESDLVHALRSGHLRAAALDVLEDEPPKPDNPLLRIDNVILAPHLAGADELSLTNMGIEAAQCIVALHQGRWPDGAVVNHELREGWKW